MITVSTPRSPARAGRLPAGTGAGRAGVRRDGSGRGAAAGLAPGYAPGDACAPAWRAGPDRLATLVTRTSVGSAELESYGHEDRRLVPNPPSSPSYGYVAPFCTVQPALVSAL